MSAPQRKLIREAVVDLLIGQTEVGEKVFGNRIRPVHVTELPCILVYALSDEREIWLSTPRTYKSSLVISVEIQVDSINTLDLELDALSSQVEYLLHQDHTLSEVCEDVIHQSTDINLSDQGEKLYGSAILTYAMPYYYEAVRDPIYLKDFLRADIEYDIVGNPTGQIDATDTVTGFYE